jgi:hypothetical protein
LAGGEQGEPSGGTQPGAAPDPEVVGHALGRLEAALRARTAPGFNV